MNITLTNQPASSTRTLSGNYAGFAGTFNVGVGAGPGFGKIQINGADSAALTLNALPNASVFVASGTHLAAINLFGGDTGEPYGQLRLDGGTWAGPITLSGEITTNSDSIVGAYGSTGTLSGDIGETGGPRTLTKGGAGTIVLSGVNTYSGGTVFFTVLWGGWGLVLGPLMVVMTHAALRHLRAPAAADAVEAPAPDAAPALTGSGHS